MTILNIYRKIHFHFLYYFVAFLAIITGLFKDFVVFSLIIFIHEWGHFITACYFNWKVDKIIILPFGGITIFNDLINKSMFEELMIAVAGPLMQIIFYLVCIKLNIVTDTLTNFHYLILFFNLLPIIPLDGSKILFLFLEKIFPYKLSHYLLIFLSFFNIFIILFYSIYYDYGLTPLIVITFITYKVYDELQKHPYYFNKFLFERYLYKISYPKNKFIKGHKIKKMFRNYHHLFLIEGKYHREQEILGKRFDFEGKL